MTRLEERNQKIIEAIVKKAAIVCPGSLALIGVYGSFMTGDIHPKSDLDLLILINDDNGLQLGSTFILEDEMVGHDIYCTDWKSLRNDAEYEHPQISKLMDSKIVYCADTEYLEKLEGLRSLAKAKIAVPLTEEDFDKALNYLKEAQHCMFITQYSENRTEVLKGAGETIYLLENAVAMLNKRYFRSGVKQAYEELNGMEKRPDHFCDLIEKVILASIVDEVKDRLTILVKETTDTFVKEGIKQGISINIHTEQEEMDETIFKDVESKHGDHRKPVTADILSNTYEEMFSNWRNKMYLAAETGNHHLAFMSLNAFSAMLSEISDEWKIRDYDPLSGYDPMDLYATAHAFDSILDAYLKEYRKVGLQVNRYANVDDFIADYLKVEI